MTGPQTLTITTSSPVAGSPLLRSSFGSAGSFTLGVGGSAPISSTTPDRDCSGSFTITVVYN